MLLIWLVILLWCGYPVLSESDAIRPHLYFTEGVCSGHGLKVPSFLVPYQTESTWCLTVECAMAT